MNLDEWRFKCADLADRYAQARSEWDYHEDKQSRQELLDAFKKRHDEAQLAFYQHLGYDSV